MSRKSVAIYSQRDEFLKKLQEMKEKKKAMERAKN